MEKEMLDYLLSTGLYEKGTEKHPYTDLFYEKEMLSTDKTISIKDLTERLIGVDKEFEGSPWNIRQILSNINMIVPAEDKRKHGEWVLLDECANEGVYCSCCGKKVYKINYANQKLKSKYCPNCGAIMDL